MIYVPRTDRTLVGNWWWTVDRFMLGGVALLAVVGTILIFAASPAVGERVYGAEMHFVVKHLFFLLPASCMLVVVSLLAPLGVLRLAVGMLGLFGFLLVLTLLFAPEVKGAHRWLVLFGMPLQPSEFVKPALIVVTAYLLSRRERAKAMPTTALLVLPVLAVLAKQPDIGMAAVISLVYCAQLFVAGIAWIWVLALIGAVVFGAWQAYLWLPHFTERVNGFLDPDSLGYQIERALRAVAAGGLFGRGPGEGVQKWHLPDAHADFIFAATAEEFGIIACLFLVVVFASLILRGLWRVHETTDRFIQLAAVGLVAQFGLQALINMAVNLNLMPTKGMTLPFISYGGSSLLALAIGMGMLLALTRRGARLELPLRPELLR
ncbi:FtsW/RodA/SpoVE family cell cycle protein [Benzoatithermus flavus]|uniref:Probable peptidoglycan glycosyltransferase FtsW n=1 Tax=Benzoatithermus flavus TaxID=3108223 RepID=A0ABU8XN13_9PROT